MATYTGAWRRTQKYAPSGLGDNPNLGDEVNKLHLFPAETGDPFPEPTPGLPALPPSMYAQDDYMLPLSQAMTDPIITEPLGHEYGHVQRDNEPPDEAIIRSYEMHSADYGAAAVHHHNHPIMRADADTYATPRLAQDFETSISRAALTRGRNALPENNPEGPPPQGTYTMRWIDRQFTRQAIRHDAMPLYPYTAGIAKQTPAPTGAAATPYTTPWDRIANARSLKLSRPQVRRVPRLPEDLQLVDGTEDPQYSQPVYWEF